MRTIEVDDDVYFHIAQNTKEIGEPASSILHRLLGLSKTTAMPTRGKAGAGHELGAAMADSKFLMQTAAVDRFLYFLGVAYTQKRSDYEKVLAIQGRDRKYFAKSKEDVEKSGNSTQPRNIPGTSYWVMTNSPTSQKRQMLRNALKLLDYSDAAISAATSTIR
ncbi:MAG: hypothetical protein ACREUK_09695 [Burkholderiales bacterium]